MAVTGLWHHRAECGGIALCKLLRNADSISKNQDSDSLKSPTSWIALSQQDNIVWSNHPYKISCLCKR